MNPDDAKKILAEATNMISNQCVCSHPRQGHHTMAEFGTTGCMDEECDCLEFEGV